MISDIEMALHLIQSRRKSEEALRDAHVAHGRYSDAAGCEAVSVGLIIAEKIIMEEYKLFKKEN
jgi:hypothetical protein